MREMLRMHYRIDLYGHRQTAVHSVPLCHCAHLGEFKVYHLSLPSTNQSHTITMHTLYFLQMACFVMWQTLCMSQRCTRFNHTAILPSPLPLYMCAILLSAHSALLHTVSPIGFTINDNKSKNIA
jgi:hypothetical protein